jgi:pimeloyl-ACP methyl ester carboxylesterase
VRRAGALFPLLLALCTAPALAQDYEREKRWATEIVPSLVVGEAVQIPLPSRTFLGIHAETKTAKPAVLLVHGVGVHPDHGVIGVLRASLADLGYTTLSIQMPVQKSDAGLNDYYPKVFPEAVERIRAGAQWLKDKGAGKIVLLSHSMGSWMSNVYYEQTREPPFAAWVCLGLTGGFGGMANVKVPVLDVYGANDLPPVLRADWRRRFTLSSIPGSRQVVIPGADHHYLGKEAALTAAIDGFLSQLK